jgi:hypothetical protein
MRVLFSFKIVEHPFHFFRLDFAEGQVVEDDKAVTAHFIGQDGLYRQSLDFSVDLHRKIAGFGGENHSAAAPLGRANRTLAGVARAFLPPRLPAAAAHFRAGEGGLCAPALVSEVRHDTFVDDVLVLGYIEYFAFQVDIPDLGA